MTLCVPSVVMIANYYLDLGLLGGYARQAEAIGWALIAIIFWRVGPSFEEVVTERKRRDDARRPSEGT
jgi:hypothetical protein